MFWVKKKLRKLPPYISFYIAHQTLLREFTLTHGNHFHQRFEWSWFGTEAQSYVMSLGSHICLPLKYSFHSLLLLCGEAVTSAETEGVISLGWPGVHAWRSPMGLGARWYGPGEWLPSEIQQLRILQTSLWPAPSQAAVPDGPALTNRESFLAWTVQSNLPLPEPQVKGDDTQNHVMGLFPTAIGCSSQSRWILCPWHTDTLNFLE